MTASLPCVPSRRAPLVACLTIALCWSAPDCFGASFPAVGPLVTPVRPAQSGARPGFARAHTWRPAVERPSMTVPVTSCADDGSPGTLRVVVAGAASGDVVDMSQLTCGTITLATGQIDVTVDDLTLQGPGQTALTIDAHGASRVIAAYGSGTLSIADLTLANGYSTDPGFGGCLYSYVYEPSSVTLLTRVTVDGCTATGAAGTHFVLGGGIVAFGSLTLDHSTLSNNTATAPNGTSIQGGGAYVSYDLVISDSTVSDNSATKSTAGSTDFALGGGIQMRVADTQSSITGSTFSANAAGDYGGAFFVYVPPSAGATPTLSIVNSTVSGNTSGSAAGIQINPASNAPFQLNLANSTIAFNTAIHGTCGGIAQAGYTPSVVDLESAIIADNAGSGGADYDACASDTASSLIGANNLIMVSELPVPADTISDDPVLGPLQDNGGPTWTLALFAGSPAIDHGNDAAGVDFDQRGAGFPRVVGAQADIGAYEVQAADDTIFADGFDP